jgi:3-oxoacyl-[acyl-carrier protein] reductase
MNLDQSRAIVTGGAAGMGRAFVAALAREGASVVAADVSDTALAATVDALRADGLKVHGVRCDVSREEEVEALFDAAEAAFGAPVNTLVNNAGIFRDALLVKPDGQGGVKTMSLAQWQQVLDVDLTGPFLCTRALAARWLRAREAVEGDVSADEAVVVNISSVARHGNRGQSNYSAAKAGLVADTRLWADELARYGVRVGAVAPGFVRTPILDGMRPEVLARMVSTVPLGRVGEPEEIWQAVRFILTCRYFTGRCIDVDGGLTL